MRKKYVLGSWCILSAFFMLMICSRSSFLYPCNDWNDANSFFTIGKAFMAGQVPYRDLFEQKGPYLYLIYGIASLISHNSFLGVFVLEIMSLTLFLYFAYRIEILYCREKTALFLLPVLACSITVSKSFYWGGSAEEFCLPFLCISLYDTIRYFKEGYPKKADYKVILRNGIFAGIIALIKYTLLGFYFAWIGIIIIACFVRKDKKRGIYFGLTFLGGMFAAFLPWLIYFAVNGALADWYQCYIYINVFLYSNLGNTISFSKRFYDLAKIMYWFILDNFSYFLPIIIGFVYIFFSGKTKWYERINIYSLFLLLFLGIYVGGSQLPYYSIPLMVFSPIGIAVVGLFVDKVATRILEKKWVMVTLMSISFIISTIGAYNLSMNSFFISYEKEDFFLFRFKHIVELEKNPTLFVYNCLDAGLYTVADIMPNCRFFHRCNLNYKEMLDMQYEYLETGKTQFVLTADTYPEIILEKYDLAAQELYDQRIYFLFKRK